MIRASSQAPAMNPTEAPARAHQTRRLRFVIAITCVILLVEVAGGLLSGSLALLSDAGHMLTDLLALVLSLMAVRFASLPANAAKTYGYHRLEILTALVNGSILILVSILLAWKSATRFMSPAPIEGGVMMAVAAVGLAANLFGLALLSGHHDNLNMRGARMHILADAYSSGGVLLASVAIALTGWVRLDPLVAGAIAVGIAVGAVRLVREAVDVLLEAAPAGIALEAVTRAMAEIPGVLEVHDLHVWSITTGLPALSGHVRIDARTAPSADHLLVRIREVVRERFGIDHTTIQIETAGYDQAGDARC